MASSLPSDPDEAIFSADSGDYVAH